MSAVGQALIAEVRRIAAETPDYVYSSDQCMYMHEGQPSCIIGKALFNLGYLPNAKAGIEDQGVNTALRILGLEVDANERRWLTAVQFAQDGNDDKFQHIGGQFFDTSRGSRHRLSWGNAVKYADGELS